MRISIVWGSGKVIAELEETPTGRKFIDALPCESKANTWGDEVYFSVPVSAELEEDARQVVDSGTVCFWVEGSSLAIPFGPTPISQGDECRLVTKVNVVGRIEGDPTLLGSVRDGDRIRVERVAE
ncbi:MAG: cyclophilin-like fold protein [Thermodesulfobacteriota bacterium]